VLKPQGHNEVLIYYIQKVDTSGDKTGEFEPDQRIMLRRRNLLINYNGSENLFKVGQGDFQ